MAASSCHETSADLYDKLHRVTLTRGQLRENGYPYMERGQGTFVISTFKYQDSTVIRKRGNERVCERCSDVFLVGEDGLAPVDVPCFYHVGRYLKIQDWYSCCERKRGCQRAEKHVHMYNYFNDTSGYVETRPSQSTPQNVYALDCEMVYTKDGYDVVRVVVVDDKQNIVLNEYIKPNSPVVDWNTRYSGLTERDLSRMTISLEDFQKKLLDVVCDKTILVGHSLNHDLISLKIVHGLVIDTSVLCKDGKGRKRGLKNLAEIMLKKVIQQPGAGHDCQEDAQTAMQLALLKTGGSGYTTRFRRY